MGEGKRETCVHDAALELVGASAWEDARRKREAEIVPFSTFLPKKRGK